MTPWAKGFLFAWSGISRHWRELYKSTRFASGARDEVRLLIIAQVVQASTLGPDGSGPGPRHMTGEQMQEVLKDRKSGGTPGWSDSTYFRGLHELDQAKIVCITNKHAKARPVMTWDPRAKRWVQAVDKAGRKRWKRPALEVAPGPRLKPILGVLAKAANRAPVRVLEEVREAIRPRGHFVRQPWESQYTSRYVHPGLEGVDPEWERARERLLRLVRDPSRGPPGDGNSAGKTSGGSDDPERP